MNIALDIIDAGIENATNTQTYIKQRLNDPKIVDHDLKSALNKCADCFQAGIGSLRSAYGEIKDDNEYMTANYNLSLVDEQIYKCDYFLTQYNVEEQIVSMGLKYVTYFSYPALHFVKDLESTPPPQYSFFELF